MVLHVRVYGRNKTAGMFMLFIVATGVMCGFADCESAVAAVVYQACRLTEQHCMLKDRLQEWSGSVLHQNQS